MRRHIINLVLLFLIGAVAALVWMRQDKPEPPPEPLIASQTEAIDRVGFRIPGGASVMAQRAESGWRLIEPVSAPADSGVINSLLSTARAPVSDRVAASEVELPQMGFDNPERYMVFDQTEIAFGAINPVTKKRYVLKGDTVLQISDPAGASSYHDHAKLVHKDVVPPGRTLVAVVLPQWTLERVDGSWQAQSRSDNTESVSAARAEAAGNAWASARAMWTSTPMESRGGPAESVELRFANGDEVRLGVIRGQQLLLRRPDFRVQYHVAKNLSGLLLDLEAPPEEPAGEATSATPPGEGVMAPAGG